MKVRRLLGLATFALSLQGGCCMPGGLVGLDQGEHDGIAALVVTIGDYGEETGDERAKRIHAELAEALDDGRFLRGDCEGQYVLGRTCDDLVCLDSDVAFDLEVLRRNAENCMLALAILFHEGVHLDQDLSDFLFSDHEEDAYRSTHAMQIWLAGELAARVAPLPGVQFTPEAAFAALETTRIGMGEDYLAETCPAHVRRRRLVQFIADHPEDDLAWVEIPPLAHEARARGDGCYEVAIELDRRLDEAAPQIISTFLGRKHPEAAPSWSSVADLIVSAADVEFVMGWYVARRGKGPNLADDWNRRRERPLSWRIENDQLLLVYPAPPGEGEPTLAFSITALLLPSPPKP